MTTGTAVPVTTGDSLAPTVTSSHREVVNAIVRETSCSRTQAKQTIRWLKELVDRARAVKYRTVYPTDAQLTHRAYKTFDLLFSHGVAPRPGSAAAKVVALLLDSRRDELTIIHNMTDGDRRYCTVTVCTSAMIVAR